MPNARLWPKILTVTSTTTDDGTVDVYLCNGTFTLTLAGRSRRRNVEVLNIGSGTITVASSVGSVLGVSSLAGQYTSAIYAFDGSNWYARATTSGANAFALNGVTAGTATASKATILGASGEIDIINFGAIGASDSSLGIDGQAAAQGGAIVATGGASSTATNAGGAVTLKGGTGNTSGAGGAANLLGGVGGATGIGGQVNVTGGVPTDAAGGAVVIAGGAGVGTNRAGGLASVTGGASTGSATGGVASLVGGAASAATGTGGAVSIAGGAGNTSGLGGAVTVTSGAGGATAASGAVTIASGAVTATGGAASGAISINTPAGATASAGATGGASGAITIQTNAGGTTATGTGGAGGLVSILAGAGGLTTGNGTAGGAGGGLTLTAGAGGAGSTPTTGGAGGAVAITAGAGGNGTTSGAAGSVTITAGAAGTGGNVAGGTINLVPGAAVGTGLGGEVQVNSVAGTFEITYTAPLMTTAVPASGTAQPIYIATRAMRLKKAYCSLVTFNSSPTISLTKDSSGTAPGGGTAMLASVMSPAANNTPVTQAASSTVATATLAAGDRISFLTGGTIGTSAGLTITMLLTPV
jgi:hypothetical protein